jgi:RHS repeat-associated protein
MTGNGTTDYIYQGVQCIEERIDVDTFDTPVRQYVWGRYIDELIQMRESPYDSPVDHLMLSDLLYRGTALVDADSGDIVEAYDTDAYGNTLIFILPDVGDWSGALAIQGDNPKCPFIFPGRRYDPETEIYYYRARYYVPELGRFISRDPIGYATSFNLYMYALDNPVRVTDAYGLDEEDATLRDYLESARDNVKKAELLNRIQEAAKDNKPMTSWDGFLGKLRVYGRARLQSEILGATDALDQFKTNEPCGRWYRDAMRKILSAASECKEYHCKDIGGIVAGAGETRFDKCSRDIMAKSGRSGATMTTAFTNFANSLAVKCVEMVKVRKRKGLCPGHTAIASKP